MKPEMKKRHRRFWTPVLMIVPIVLVAAFWPNSIITTMVVVTITLLCLFAQAIAAYGLLVTDDYYKNFKEAFTDLEIIRMSGWIAFLLVFFAIDIAFSYKNELLGFVDQIIKFVG